MASFNVRAHLDRDAGVWWAESDDVPGLVAEAETHDALVEELHQLIPELLAMNMPDVDTRHISFTLVSDQVEDLHVA